MDDEVLQQIRANAQLVIAKLGPTSGIQTGGVMFGYNRESVAYLAGLIERLRLEDENRPEPPDTLVSTLGSFFGECLVAGTGGQWYWDAELDQYGVALVSAQGQQHAVFPFAKLANQFANGIEGGDSVLGMYDIVLEGLATGKMDR